MQVWNVLRAARRKSGRKKVAKNRHLGTIAQLCRAISSQIRHVSTVGKKLVKERYLIHICPHDMVNFGPLSAEIVSWVWGTPGNFNWFRVLAALLHGTLVVDVSQTLRRWTEGATYIRQGGYHVGHWPTFLVMIIIYGAREGKCRNHHIILANVAIMLSPVRLSSVCLWRSCTLLSRLKFSVMFLNHLVPWTSADIYEKFYGGLSRVTPPSGGLNARGVAKMPNTAILDISKALYRKRCKI